MDNGEQKKKKSAFSQMCTALILFNKVVFLNFLYKRRKNDVLDQNYFMCSKSFLEVTFFPMLVVHRSSGDQATQSNPCATCTPATCRDQECKLCLKEETSIFLWVWTTSACCSNAKSSRSLQYSIQHRLSILHLMMIKMIRIICQQ